MTSEPSFVSSEGRFDPDPGPTVSAVEGPGERCLIAFYSLSGHTRALAGEIRNASGGDLEEIVEPGSRTGFIGELRSLADSLLRSSPTILPIARDPAAYDLLLLGGPVWAGRIAAPVRSYARNYGANARRVAFFCTYDSDGYATALQELANLCGRQPEAVLAVPSHALVSGAHEADVRRFLAEVLVADAMA